MALGRKQVERLEAGWALGEACSWSSDLSMQLDAVDARVEQKNRSMLNLRMMVTVMGPALKHKQTLSSSDRTHEHEAEVKWSLAAKIIQFKLSASAV